MSDSVEGLLIDSLNVTLPAGPMSKNFDTRTYFDPGCITFTMIPNYKLLHEFELTWSFYIVVDLHYLSFV